MRHRGAAYLLAVGGAWVGAVWGAWLAVGGPRDVEAEEVAAQGSGASLSRYPYPSRYQAAPGGFEPWQLVERDFTGDGAGDLAVLHSKGIRLLSVRGEGSEDGSFAATDLVIDDVGSMYDCRLRLAAGDWNVDGLPDLAGAFGEGEVKIILNLGGGRFAEGSEIMIAAIVEGTIRSLASGDLDRDGAEDLLVALRPAGGQGAAIAALFSRRDGRFEGASHGASEGSEGNAVSAAVVRSADSTLVALGVDLPAGKTAVRLAACRSDRTFGPWVDEPAWADIGAEVRARDIDADGVDEVIILDREEVFARNAAIGSLSPSPRVAFRYEDQIIADFTALGRLALVADGSWDGLRCIRIGEDGGIVSEEVLSTGGIPQALEVSDLDRDGVPDVAVALLGQLWHDEPVFGGVTAGMGFARDAEVGFELPRNEAPHGWRLRSLEILDLDADGDRDAIVSMRSVSGFETLLGRPAGAVSIMERRDGSWLARETVSCEEEPLGEVEVADLDRDGALDIVVCPSTMDTSSADSIRLFFGIGTPDLEEQRSIVVGESPIAARVDDPNGDGIPDLLVLLHGCHCYPGNESHLAFLAGRGDGTFEAPRLVRAGQYARDLELRDLDGDGLRDAVILCLATPTRPGLLVLGAKGPGEYAERQIVEIPTGSALEAGDVDGDGAEELLVAGEGVFFCDLVEGRIEEPRPVSTEISGATAAAIGDVTGDGVPDVVVAQSSWDHIVNDRLRVVRGEGGGGFIEGDPILSGLGTCDLFVGAVDEGGASVLTVAGSLYEHSSSFLVSLALPGAIGELPFRRGDANGDETVDLSDTVFVLSYLFLGAEEPGCDRSADADDSGELEISDPIFLLNHLFLGGPTLPAPYPGCGADVTPDVLGCRVSPCRR